MKDKLALFVGGVMLGLVLAMLFHEFFPPEPAPPIEIIHRIVVRPDEDGLEALCWVELNGKCHGVIVRKR